MQQMRNDRKNTVQNTRIAFDTKPSKRSETKELQLKLLIIKIYMVFHCDLNEGLLFDFMPNLL